MIFRANSILPTVSESQPSEGIYTDFLSGLLDSTNRFLTDFGPGILAGILVILVGWVLAVFFRLVVSRLLQASGFDLLVDRCGLRAFLDRKQINSRVSSLLGWVVYITILYASIVKALNLWQLFAAEDFLRLIASWVPVLLLALVLFLIGAYLARVSGVGAVHGARLLGLPAPEFVGKAVRAVIYLITIFVILDLVGFVTWQVLFGSLLLVLVAVLVGVLLLATCGRSVVESILTRSFLQENYSPGDRIEWEGKTGTIQAIRSTVTLVTTEDGVLVVPNRVLHNGTVRKFSGNEEDTGSSDTDG